jgi:hypothetical protein
MSAITRSVLSSSSYIAVNDSRVRDLVGTDAAQVASRCGWLDDVLVSRIEIESARLLAVGRLHAKTHDCEACLRPRLFAFGIESLALVRLREPRISRRPHRRGSRSLRLVANSIGAYVKQRPRRRQGRWTLRPVAPSAAVEPVDDRAWRTDRSVDVVPFSGLGQIATLGRGTGIGSRRRPSVQAPRSAPPEHLLTQNDALPKRRAPPKAPCSRQRTWGTARSSSRNKRQPRAASWP